MTVSIKTSKADIIWNYVGTIISMAGNYLLIPFLLLFLSESEVGLWYVFLSISNLTLLFDFGFNATFARNIVYVLSGAKKLSKEKMGEPPADTSVDWHLLNVVLKSVKALYAAIGIAVLMLAGTLGTWYICSVTEGLDTHYLAEWGIFCIAIFLNLYFLYTSTFLRGYGDIASENKVKTISRAAQLLITLILLFMGTGLMGASLGFLAGALILRALSIVYLSRHTTIKAGLAAKGESVSVSEMRDVLSSVSYIAWRDGVVQISLYASSQATTIVCSLFTSLAETGMFSILLQIANALCHFAQAYAKAYLPEFQSAYAQEDGEKQTAIVGKGLAVYWILALLGTLGVCVIVLPLLPLFKQGLTIDYPFYMALSVYLVLLNHHSLCCNFIISTNQIPYLRGYLLAAIGGIAVSTLCMSVLDGGIWGLLFGQFICQIVYNNWYWPAWLCRELNVRYFETLKDGLRQMLGKHQSSPALRRKQ